MNFVSHQTFTESNPPELGPEMTETIQVTCSYCGRKSNPGYTDNAALGAAVGSGWKLRLLQSTAIGIVGLEDRTFGPDIFCARCLTEFET